MRWSKKAHDTGHGLFLFALRAELAARRTFKC
jgi:hypothetical protein